MYAIHLTAEKSDTAAIHVTPTIKKTTQIPIYTSSDFVAVMLQTLTAETLTSSIRQVKYCKQY